MAIWNLEKVNINNSLQWILVRGKRLDTPLIIHVQGGPGLPMISEANAIEKLLHLENDYLVTYWDQRACGKSFNKNIDPKTINLSQLTDDVIACTQYLLRKYKKDKAILAGYSIGATASLLAAAKNSSLFRQLFLVGIDIDIPFANQYALDFAMNKAKAANNKKLIRQIAELRKKPIIETKKFQQRAKLLTNMGGIKAGSSYNKILVSTIKNMLLSKAYRLNDIPKTIKGMKFSQNALLPEFDSFNLFHEIRTVSIPVHFAQGKLDAIAPYQMATRFYKYLQAPIKTFTEFENSAHLPQYEEPDKFADLLKRTSPFI
jgi:pimeloyl-ACP methyl ester carboxylesterase